MYKNEFIRKLKDPQKKITPFSFPVQIGKGTFLIWKGEVCVKSCEVVLSLGENFTLKSYIPLIYVQAGIFLWGQKWDQHLVCFRLCLIGAIQA